MNPKVRNNFAVVAVGALACSLSFAPVAMAAPDVPVNPVLPGVVGDAYRVAGQSRFGTAIAASKALGSDVKDTVILSNYTSWSDVLAATPLADQLDAPVLYTFADRLELETINELKRLKVLRPNLKITLVGGELAINKSVVAELKSVLGTNTMVDRVGGQSRFDTAMLLAAETVDYYNGGANAVANARATIAAQKQLDENALAAQAKYEAAQAVTAAALTKQYTAAAELVVAQQTLATLTGQLVGSFPVSQTINGVAPADVAAANALLVPFESAAFDANVRATFVNARLATYLATPGNVVTDTWQDVIDFFDAQVFTINLKAGPATGTLAVHSGLINTAVGTSNASSAQAYVNAVTAVKTTSDTAADTVRGEYAIYLSQVLAAIQAANTNATLQAQINAASLKVTAATAARNAAAVAVFDAYNLEINAQQDALDAFTARPSLAVKLAASQAYDVALAAALAGGTLYPAFLATGLDFPDALAAGPAAAEQKGVVLLTNGAQMSPAAQKYLNSGAASVAVGGPAAAAMPSAAKKFVGQSRYETATLLAAAYFDDAKYIGLASGEVAADAVIGGALTANLDGTLVLTRATLLPTTTSSFLSYKLTADPKLLVFGGTLAVSNNVRADAVQALKD